LFLPATQSVSARMSILAWIFSRTRWSKKGGLRAGTTQPSGPGGAHRLELRRCNAISLQRRAEPAAHIFRRALALSLRSLEESRSQSALGLEEYSLRKHF
jgi:hypothetical protein